MNPLPESFVTLLLDTAARDDCPEPLRAGIAEYLATGDDSALGRTGMLQRGFDVHSYAVFGPLWGAFISHLYNRAPGTSVASCRIVSITEEQVSRLSLLLPPPPDVTTTTIPTGSVVAS